MTFFPLFVFQMAVIIREKKKETEKENETLINRLGIQKFSP